MSKEWDKKLVGLANYIGFEWSKDPSTKVGCVIADDNHIPLGVGYNGFPRGIEDTPERLNDRPTKYKLVVHAEVNAVLNATAPVRGATAYNSLAPCSDCMKLMINAGIKRVVFPTPSDDELGRWGESFKLASEMAAEAGVEMVQI